MNLLLLASFGEIMEYVGYILIAILVLLLMITVHELGHYIAGKILGFDIEEFAIGFGPKLLKKTKKNGEIFSVRLLPLGGFCAFKGEDGESTEEGAFTLQKPWKRIIVLVAGAFMNYLLALIIIVLMFSIYGAPAYKVSNVVYDGEYASYSLSEGDVILSANGKNVYLTTDLMSAINGKTKDEQVSFVVIREGKTQKIEVKLRADATFSNIEDARTLFLALGTYYVEGDYMYSGIVNDDLRVGIFGSIGRSFEYSGKLGGTVFTVLGQLLTGRLGINSVGGTITTITVTANAVKTGGFKYLLYIGSLIGVNLAIFNLLPIPALDGAHVVFTLIEWIRKKPVNRKIENIVHTVGLILLFGFAVLVDLLQWI